MCDGEGEGGEGQGQRREGVEVCHEAVAVVVHYCMSAPFLKLNNETHHLESRRPFSPSNAWPTPA